MQPLLSARTALQTLTLLSVAQHLAKGHSWIDCFDTDRSKVYDQSASYIFGGAGGNGFCAGYGAGFPGRGDVDIGKEYTYKILKNEADAGAPVCANVGANTYTDWRKRLRVTPGQKAYYGYLPNGHIVKDKKGVGTQHGIYWTGQVGTSLTSTRDMTPQNLINGRTFDFDDGNCGETVDYNGNPSHRAGDGKPCIGSFTVPIGTAPGIYKMLWYWTFWLDDQSAYRDQEMARGYFGAAYSTCFEVEVVPGGGEVGNGDTVQQADPSGATPPPVGPQPEVGNEAVQMPPSSPPAASPVQMPPIVAVSAPKELDAKPGSKEIPAPATPPPASPPSPAAPISDEAAEPAKVKPAKVSQPEIFSPPASGFNGAGCRRRFRS